MLTCPDMLNKLRYLRTEEIYKLTVENLLTIYGKFRPMCKGGIFSINLIFNLICPFYLNLI